MIGKPEPSSVLLYVKDAAQQMNCSEKAIRAHVARGTIPYRKLGKRVVFLREELEQFIRSLPGTTLEEARKNQEART